MFINQALNINIVNTSFSFFPVTGVYKTLKMFMPKAHRVAIYEYLFKEGVIVAKKDFHAPKHPELENIPNLHVIKTMQSLHSRGLVKEQFAWRHYYWYLTNEGIEFLRSYLHLPPEIVPATLKRPTRPETVRPRPAATTRSGDASKTGEDRSAYRRAPGGTDKKGDVGPGAGEVEFRGVCSTSMSYHIYTNQSDDERYADYNDDSRSNNFEQNAYDSEEDTDDASETELRNSGRNHGYGTSHNTNSNNHELKEQMYQHKLASLQKQLEELKQLTHPEYLRRLKKLEYQFKERLRLNEIYRDYLKECVERDYILEKKAAEKEYEEKKVDLKDNILTDFEERRKLIENERFSLELTNDSMEIKPTVTRKLRRRPNEPVPVVEKRRKPTTGQLLVYMLDEKEIENDLKIIQRGKPLTPTLQQNGVSSYGNSNHHQSSVISDNANQYMDTRIEDGKLLYEKRWFHRGQQVYIEGKDLPKFAATISAIGNEVVWVKKPNESKVKINMSHLAKGKVTIKRRAN
uniref:S10_plectin domain-containing protein n=1 Tax=Glossina brevipalpis TaxID=37001 RepID=A0A1A9WB20_9MUSC